MSRNWRAVLIVLLLALCFAVGRCTANQDPRTYSPLSAQQPWSHGRVISDPPVILDVVRAPIDEDGSVGRAEQVAHIGSDDADRVVDFVIDPGYSYVTACGFTVRDPITYVDTQYLPLVTLRW